jgi:hypothetical protein
MSSVIWPVAIRMTWTALPITSAGRLSPFGPLGIPGRLLLGGKNIAYRQNCHRSIGGEMLYRMVIGTTALAICLMVNGRCMAAGAVALGQPSDIAKDGLAIYTNVNSPTPARAKELAMAGCKSLPHSFDTSKALCKIVATFENQCVAQALDPKNGTPGFGWAMARNSKLAKEQALSNCRDTAGPTRQDACVVDSHSLWCDGSAR